MFKFGYVYYRLHAKWPFAWICSIEEDNKMLDIDVISTTGLMQRLRFYRDTPNCDVLERCHSLDMDKDEIDTIVWRRKEQTSV